MKSESLTKPLSLEHNYGTVYIRTNIKTEERIDYPSEEKQMVYIYNEETYSEAEYAAKLAEQNSQAIDDILVAQLGG